MPDEPYNDDLGNGTARPRSADSDNGILEHLTQHLNIKESSYADSSYWSDSQEKPYNPDDLVRKRYDYSIYEDMGHDDQVAVCLQIKRDLILAGGFSIVVEDDDPALIKMRDEIEKSLRDDLEIPLLDSLEEITTAYEFGFSISEKVFKVKNDGNAALKYIKTRHPVTWLIHTDVHGNIVKYEQRGPAGSVDINPDVLIHYKVNQRFQNPYGKSDLRSCWEAWFIKKEIIKFYAIFLEKAASPTPVATYDTNMPQSAVDDIYNAIKKIQTKTALVVPKSIEIDWLESSSQGEVYIKGITLFNMFIGRSLLVPDLLGFQGQETAGGSYSLGKDQLKIFFRHIHRRRQSIEDMVNKEIIKPLVYYNYGNVEKCPEFKLHTIDDDELVELAKLWLEAVKGKVYKPNDEEINHFRTLAKFPDGVVIRDEIIEDPMVPGELVEPEPAPDKDLEEEKQLEQQAEKEKIKDNESLGKNYKRHYKDTQGDYSKKVNFKLVENTMDVLKDGILTESQPIIDDIFHDLFSQIRKKKIIASQSIEKLDEIKLKHTSKLKNVLKSAFKKAHKDAKAQAQAEILKGNNFASPPLPNEEFLRFLEEETFQYIGDWEYGVKKDVKIKLIQAIKDGTPLSDVLGILDDEGRALAELSLERFSRTKLTEVMNRGRHEFFESTGVIAAYQYSAILDDRTSDICEGLHGMIFDKGTEPIPPLHFNCRSVLVPITKYEEYKADKSVDGMNIQKFIDENISSGFSIK